MASSNYLNKAAEHVNAAKTPTERQVRKNELFVALYGTTESLGSWFKRNTVQVTREPTPPDFKDTFPQSGDYSGT